MVRQTVARIDLSALTDNYRCLVESLQREADAAAARTRNPNEVPRASGLIAVVKANAYGHGAAQVVHSLENAGADLVACADIEEGTALRAAGVRAEILVFGALSVSDLDGLYDGRLTPTISTPFAARAVQAAAARYKTRIKYHLKIDTGMNRLGFRFDNLRRTLPELLASPNLELDAVYTHFATADEPGSPLFDQQRERFTRALAVLADLGARPRYRHAANSAAFLRDSRVWYERVRPGLLLYGIVPLVSTVAGVGSIVDNLRTAIDNGLDQSATTQAAAQQLVDGRNLNLVSGLAQTAAAIVFLLLVRQQTARHMRCTGEA